MKIWTLCLLLFISLSLGAQPRKKFVYKKYEKFDFEEISLQGEVVAPGDLSVMTRFQRHFRNKLPYKRSFNRELKRSLKRIK